MQKKSHVKLFQFRIIAMIAKVCSAHLHCANRMSHTNSEKSVGFGAHQIEFQNESIRLYGLLSLENWTQIRQLKWHGIAMNLTITTFCSVFHKTSRASPSFLIILFLLRKKWLWQKSCADDVSERKLSQERIKFKIKCTRTEKKLVTGEIKTWK